MTHSTDPTVNDDNDNDVDDTEDDSARDERLGPLGAPSEDSSKPPSYNDEGQ